VWLRLVSIDFFLTSIHHLILKGLILLFKKKHSIIVDALAKKVFFAKEEFHMKEESKIIFHLSDTKNNQQYTIEGQIDKAELDKLLDTQTPLTDLSYVINIFKTKDEVFVSGQVECLLEDLCYRCLKPTQKKIIGGIEATYIYGNENDTILKEKELESLENVIYYVGSEIDLYDRVTEALIVAIPQRFLCSEDCRGLCPFCGQDLNEEPNHECESAEEFDNESVFSKLSVLKDNLNDNHQK